MKTGLKINHRYYSYEDLIEFSESKIRAAETENWEVAVFEFIRYWLDDQPFIEQKTSGTTGSPKTIRLKKSQMIHSALQTCEYFGIDQSKNCFLCIPVEYIGGKMMVVRAAVSGANLLYVKPSQNPFRTVKEKLDFSAITPYQLRQSIDDLQGRSENETIIVGGGPVLPALEKEVVHLSTRIFSTYGMTETSSHIAVRRINGAQPSNSFRVLGDTTISTDDEDCLIIENSSLFEGLLKTRDVVQVLDQKRFRWLGRRDNVINSGGVKHHPEALEAELEKFIPGEFAISSRPHRALGEELVLVIEGEPWTEEAEAELRESLRSHFHKFQMPKGILYLREFPRTPNGKLLRKALRILH
ncbi:MAG: O-succinylbenzoic acid--CoA ligase [Saprospirales bacterium]|nr:MAG: O-succinylbenzoic acid--CoA ligase [Saprospirales bacterium]